MVFIDINLHNKSVSDVCHFFKHHYLKYNLKIKRDQNNQNETSCTLAL